MIVEQSGDREVLFVGDDWAGVTSCGRWRSMAADSDIAEAVKVVARTHQTLIWGTDPAHAAASVGFGGNFAD